MEKLGFNKSAQQAATASLATAATQSAPGTASSTAAPPAAQPPPPMAEPPPAAITVIDVKGKLEKLAAANPQKLNWQTSIVDMLKLLDMDSSIAARRELAIELGCPADKLGDSAQMNIWLHKTVLEKLAQNGGNVPKELLH
jgi:hypothetical protein